MFANVRNDRVRHPRLSLPLQQVPGRDSEHSLKASAEVAKVAETVREGRVRDGANLACKRAARLASSRSDHTHRIGVAPSAPNKRLRLLTDMGPAAASASGPRSGSSRFARANRMTRSSGRETCAAGMVSRSRSQMEATRSTIAFDSLFAIRGPRSSGRSISRQRVSSSPRLVESGLLRPILSARKSLGRASFDSRSRLGILRS
jgi:hypothetical protein